MVQPRLGTFEEWYLWEMKQRDNPKSWHYPTELKFDYFKDDNPYHSYSKAYPNKAIYGTRDTNPQQHREPYKPVQWEERGGG